MSMKDPVKSTLDGLLKVLNMDNVIGEPIESDNKILIPITRVELAFGAGMGQGGNEVEDEGFEASGAGGGATVAPVAFVMVDKSKEGPDQIEVIPLTSPDPLNKALYDISEIALEFLKEWQEKQKKNEEKYGKMKEDVEDLYNP